MKRCVYMIEKNIFGAWVVYGILGVKQYYNYTKDQARKKYVDECMRTVFVNQTGEELPLCLR